MDVPRYHEPLDAVASDDDRRNTVEREYLGRATPLARIRLAFAALFLAVLATGGRAAVVQTIHGSRSAEAAEQNRTRTLILTPLRGRIVDRTGKPLVENVTTYAIGVTPADLPTGAARTQAIAAIADLLGQPISELIDALRQYPDLLAEPVPVRDVATYGDAIALLVRSRDIPSVDLIVGSRREYRTTGVRESESVNHLLGYMGRIDAASLQARAGERYRPSDAIGRTGVEASYETALRGRAGTRTLSMDAAGRVVGTTAVEPTINGEHLALTVDAEFQSDVERALRSGLAAAGSRRGAAVALDADTGEILALVSLPAHSSSAFSRGISTVEYAKLLADPDRPLFPRAIAGVYPSGSTIKPVIAAAALSAGVITDRTTITSTGGIRVGASFFPDWKVGGHGSVTVRRALAESVNTFFYLVVGGRPAAAPASVGGPTQERALGIDRIGAALRAFGFGRTAGVDLPGEATGFVPTPAWKRGVRGEEWYIGDTYHLAIGQGDLLVTPLQLAAATAAIANGGRLVMPHVVQRRPSAAEATHGRIDGITEAALATVRSGLRDAVTDGSATGLRDLPFRVAGKTGTAEHRAGRPPHAWFTGYAEIPRDTGGRRPQRVVVTVLIEEGGEGSHTAVPVAREAFRSWAEIVGR